MKKKEYERLLSKLLAQPLLRFTNMKPSALPERAGVYLITVRKKPYYVGRTTNLRQRLYNSHLMGPPDVSRFKKYLIDSGECVNKQAAKQFLRAHASVRWIEEPDVRRRGFLECYFTAILQPKYGIAKES